MLRISNGYEKMLESPINGEEMVKHLFRVCPNTTRYDLYLDNVPEEDKYGSSSAFSLWVNHLNN